MKSSCKKTNKVFTKVAAALASILIASPMLNSCQKIIIVEGDNSNANDNVSTNTKIEATATTYDITNVNINDDLNALVEAYLYKTCSPEVLKYASYTLHGTTTHLHSIKFATVHIEREEGTQDKGIRHFDCFELVFDTPIAISDISKTDKTNEKFVYHHTEDTDEFYDLEEMIDEEGNMASRIYADNIQLKTDNALGRTYRNIISKTENYFNLYLQSIDNLM